MSIALLDVNVLIALLDPMHIHADAVHRWFERNQAAGWSTCPMTVNGCVRVLSNHKYPKLRLQPFRVIELLIGLCSNPNHHFWPDSISLLDPKLFHPPSITGSNAIGDLYLLGLAVNTHGRLATLDRSVSIKAVPNATDKNLVVIPTA